MPWTTPTLRQVRTMVRDDIMAALSGALLIGNSVLRVISDTNAGLAHLVLRYIDWLARQLLPDTAEVEWLDRHGDIWLTNADGSIGRKNATYAAGTVTMTGIEGNIVASGTQLQGTIFYEVTEQITLGSGDTVVNVRALTPGVVGNLLAGSSLSIVDESNGIDNSAIVVEIEGGTDQENDDLLRSRILFRIQKPPMGGDADDYIAWTMSVPGVTRAWSFPNEMGVGTMTVRFMLDELRVNGYPLQNDIINVMDYLSKKRPVTVKDFFVESPIPFFYDFTISGLTINNSLIRARITAAIKAMEIERVFPGQTLYRSWVDEAISRVIGEDHHELIFTTTVMPGPGYIAQVGNIIYA